MYRLWNTGVIRRIRHENIALVWLYVGSGMGTLVWLYAGSGMGTLHWYGYMQDQAWEHCIGMVICRIRHGNIGMVICKDSTIPPPPPSINRTPRAGYGLPTRENGNCHGNYHVLHVEGIFCITTTFCSG